MSTKLNKFNNEIIPLWNEVQDYIHRIDASQISDAHIANFAYLKKIITFLSEAMYNIDADYLPNAYIHDIKSHLSNIHGYLNDSQNYTNLSYISYTESSLDNLLQIIFPFILHKGKAVKGLQSGLNSYSQAINDHVQNRFSEIKLAQDNINEIENKLNDQLNKFITLRTELEEYHDSLFSTDGIKEVIQETLDDSELRLSEIEKLHQTIHGENGIKQKIDEYYSDISEQNKIINELKDNSSDTLKELENFYGKIFGEKDENGEKTGGLEQEIAQRKADLEAFKKEQQTRYNELNTQIENLLPGATSAGLSSAYNDMRDKFSKRAGYYNWAFYGSLVILLIVIYLTRDTILMNEIPLEKGLGMSSLVLLGNFAVKLPFILPALWLVIFISKRRSEAERLSQEYAHKESLAKSYDSYKKQIEKLSEKDQNALLPVLMESMIKAIALNPAETLDRKHHSDSPISEIMKDKNFINSIIDRVRNSASKNE